MRAAWHDSNWLGAVRSTGVVFNCCVPSHVAKLKEGDVNVDM
ncbi:UNVERIFIED_ORG: hypothetical protein BDU10_9380 [Burkholderia sp. CF145]|jgi:hypothetical protein|nr:hypothetical protein PMI06_008718 [Burkholderia sp. BT03]SKC51750.1 hypothetical protein SAMN06266956_0458 [Paraburkholderia hospita]